MHKYMLPWSQYTSGVGRCVQLAADELRQALLKLWREVGRHRSRLDTRHGTEDRDALLNMETAPDFHGPHEEALVHELGVTPLEAIHGLAEGQQRCWTRNQLDAEVWVQLHHVGNGSRQSSLRHRGSVKHQPTPL